MPHPYFSYDELALYTKYKTLQIQDALEFSSLHLFYSKKLELHFAFTLKLELKHPLQENLHSSADMTVSKLYFYPSMLVCHGYCLAQLVSHDLLFGRPHHACTRLAFPLILFSINQGKVVEIPLIGYYVTYSSAEYNGLLLEFIYYQGHTGCN